MIKVIGAVSVLLVIVVCLALWSDSVGAASITLVPNGSGSITTSYMYSYPTTGQDKYSMIDDPVNSPDDLSTAIRAARNDNLATESYNLVDSGISNGVINSVTVYFRIRDVTSPVGSTHYFTPFLYLSGSYSWGTVVEYNSTDWSTKSEQLSRPGGGSWSWSDIDNLQVGIRMKRSVGDALCTQLYILVDYSSGPADVVSMDAVGKTSISTLDGVTWVIVKSLDGIQ